MAKPCLIVSSYPLHPSSMVGATGLCGKRFEQPRFVPAFDDMPIDKKQGFPTGAFHAKCERAFAEMKLSGEMFIYAVSDGDRKDVG